MPKPKHKIDLKFIRSDLLVPLRKALDSIELFRQLAGPLTSFLLVIDANILIGSVYWLTRDRKNPEARGDLLECLAVGMITAYVTPTIILEVENRLVELSAATKIDLAIWKSNWDQIKPRLHVQEPPAELVAKYLTGRDPSDAPTLALAEHLNNATIVSRDLDAAAMGGRVVNAAFVLEIRNYARKKAVCLSLQYGGCIVTIGGAQAMRTLIAAGKAIAIWFRRLSPEAKTLVVLPILFLLLHPGFRSSLVSRLKTASKATAELLPIGLSITYDLMQQFYLNQASAPVADHVKPNSRKSS